MFPLPSHAGLDCIFTAMIIKKILFTCRIDKLARLYTNEFENVSKTYKHLGCFLASIPNENQTVVTNRQRVPRVPTYTKMLSWLHL